MTWLVVVSERIQQEGLYDARSKYLFAKFKLDVQTHERRISILIVQLTQ